MTAATMPGDQAEEADEQHPDDQRHDAGVDGQVQRLSDRRVDLVRQVEAQEQTDHDPDDDRHEQPPSDRACR